MKNKAVIIFFLASWHAFTSLAQVNDAGLWVSLNLEKKVSSRVKLLLSEECRFNENISELGTTFTDAGVEYRVVPKIFVSMNYRFIQEQRIDESYSLRHRYYFDVTGKFKIKKIDIDIRERFESQYTNVYSSETGSVPSNRLRSKFTLKYDLEKRYKPYVEAQVFYQLNNPKGNVIYKDRYAAGFEYEINKYFSVDLFYLINKEVNIKNPVTEYVTGLKLTWKL